MDRPGIRVVLVETSHPGNIGAAARAMKNMGLEELVLVNPRVFPHSEATARASGADDVLARARVVATVLEAVSGCGLVAATTSRERVQYFRVADIGEAAERLAREARLAPAAVLFGSERAGLTNEQLESAHLLVRIPANAEYASLNLAMAVQIVAYELYRACGRQAAAGAEPAAAPDTAQRRAPQRSGGRVLADPHEMARLYDHFARVLEAIDFRDRTQSGTHLMARIRRMLQRAELDRNEVNILRGILTAVQGQRHRAGGGVGRR